MLRPDWNSGCTRTFWALTGVVYSFSNFGLVNYFLTKDALRKISKRGTSVRSSIKTFLEMMLSVIDLLVIYAVFIRGYLDSCGEEEELSKIRFIFLVSIGLYTPYIISLVIYLYLRWVLTRNESYKAIYENFIKDKYV